MNWIGRKIHLYNVTIGLYMLDWWERYLFSILLPIASLAVVPPYPPEISWLIQRRAQSRCLFFTGFALLDVSKL